jgi:hypothetical protein
LEGRTATFNNEYLPNDTDTKNNHKKPIAKYSFDDIEFVINIPTTVVIREKKKSSQ